MKSEPNTRADAVEAHAYPELVSERRGNALYLRLNNPKALNCLSPAMINSLMAAIDIVQHAPDIRAVIFTGTGRAFCAGADLKAVEALGREQGVSEDVALDGFLQRVGELFSRIEALPVPTIAMLNGITMAGGLELALCCDLIYAESDVRIGDGHATYAMLPGGGGTVRLPKRIGLARTKFIMFSGDLYSAEECRDWGLVDLVAGPGRLNDLVENFTAKLGAKSRLGLTRMKKLVNAAWDLPAREGLQAELAECREHALSHDRNEGLAAFTEKREPRFRGY